MNNKFQSALKRHRKEEVEASDTKIDLSFLKKGRYPDLDTDSLTIPLELNIEHLRLNRILAGSENESVAVYFKVLRTQVLQELKKNNWRTIGITSPNPSDGKTTTAINLAFLISQSTQDPIILVDLDMHKSSISSTLGINNQLGIQDYLNGQCAFKDILFKPKDSNIIIIPGSKPVNNATDLITSKRMKHFMDELKNTFTNSFYFFDLPPTLVVDDVVLFNGVDANLIVSSESATLKDDLLNTIDILKGHNILGHVLNKSKNLSRRSNSSSYYYYNYGYGREKS